MAIMDKNDMKWDTIKKMMVTVANDTVREYISSNEYDKGKYGIYTAVFTHVWRNRGIGPELFVGFYSQTYDSPEGDIWEAEVWHIDRVERNAYVFTNISDKASSNRFWSSELFGAMVDEARERMFGEAKVSTFEEDFKL